MAGAAVPKVAETTRARRGLMARQEAIACYVLIGPVVLATLVLDILPMLPSLYWSFTQWDFLSTPQWVGLKSYQNLTEGVSGTRFFGTIRDTTVYTIGAIPGVIVAGLALALLVDQKLKGMAIFRGLYYLPVVTSGVAMAYAWKWVFDERFGITNVILRALSFDGIPWMSGTEWYMVAIIIITVWAQMGYNMVLYLAALQGVPPSLLEAANMDGASAWQRFWYIRLPLITPTTFFILVLSIINFFQQFTLVYILGGSRVEIYVVRLWEYAFQNKKVGEASAMAWILFIFLSILTFVQWRIQNRWVYYG